MAVYLEGRGMSHASGMETATKLKEALGRAIPIYAMGGLSGAMYRAEDEKDTEAFAVDIADWQTIVDAARRAVNPDYEAAGVRLKAMYPEVDWIAKDPVPLAMQIVDAALGITED